MPGPPVMVLRRWIIPSIPYYYHLPHRQPSSYTFMATVTALSTMACWQITLPTDRMSHHRFMTDSIIPAAGPVFGRHALGKSINIRVEIIQPAGKRKQYAFTLPIGRIKANSHAGKSQIRFGTAHSLLIYQGASCRVVRIALGIIIDRSAKAGD